MLHKINKNIKIWSSRELLFVFLKFASNVEFKHETSVLCFWEIKLPGFLVIKHPLQRFFFYFHIFTIFIFPCLLRIQLLLILLCPLVAFIIWCQDHVIGRSQVPPISNFSKYFLVTTRWTRLTCRYSALLSAFIK